MHILKKFAPRLGRKGSRSGGSPNSLGNNEHSEKARWPRENHTFEGGSAVFSRKKCTFLSGPLCRFGISHFFSVESVHSGVPFLAALQYSSGRKVHLSPSSPPIFFHFLSFSSIPSPLPFFLLFFFFLGCSKILFFASIVTRFLIKAPFFFFSFSFSFFTFFSCFSFFPLFFFFLHFFLYFPFVFPEKDVSSFSILFSLFLFFSRVLKICGGTPGFLGEKCTF